MAAYRNQGHNLVKKWVQTILEGIKYQRMPQIYQTYSLGHLAIINQIRRIEPNPLKITSAFILCLL
jgi:predicted alpha/beta hydrolase family esterase